MNGILIWCWYIDAITDVLDRIQLFRLHRDTPAITGYSLDMAKLTKDVAAARVKDLPGWELQADSITRQFTFTDFPEAVAFVVRLAFDAEAADHHPDILINYRRVTLTYSTHSEGGLTEKDFAGAAKVSALAT